MLASLEYLERCAAETGHDVGTLEKVTRLGTIASEVGRHPTLRGAVALKGGTAINLCFGEPSRLSVDLDFNFIACPDREGMLRVRPVIERTFVDLGRRLGYRVQKSAEAAAGRKLYATYRSVLGPEDRIEIDLNYLWRTPLVGVRQATLWQPGEFERPLVSIVSEEELWVGKLLALLDRTAPRDAWDVARMPMIAPELPSSPALRRWFVAMSFILDHPVETYDRARLGTRLSTGAVESQLHPMLVPDERPESAALLERAWRVVEPLVTPTPEEAEFLQRSQQADIDTTLIFGEDVEAARRFESHPQVQWKLQNLRRHLSRSE